MPTHYQGNKSDKQALDTFIKLMRAVNAVESVLRISLDEAELTVSQLGVLESLLHLGPMCQNEIASKILKSGGNITKVIDNLELKGYIERLPKPGDRRYHIIGLTVAGKNCIEKYFPEHVRVIGKIFAGLTDDEQRQLENLLKKLGMSISERLIPNKAKIKI